MRIPVCLALAIAAGPIAGADPSGRARAQDQAAAGQQGQDALFCVNAFPARLQARVETVQRQKARAGGADHGLQLVISFDRVWEKAWSGQPVTVSFYGGDANLHKQVAEAMDDWTEHANVKLDFGRNEATGAYRTWSPNDTAYSSDIRISFDHPDGGYWSLVGMDAVDPQLVGPGEASLNLQGFAGNLNADQRGTALHEMGHALGFHHEHQSPLSGCDREFRWEDAPDGTPGLYTVLGGSPNYWPRWKVDFNLRQLPNSRKLIVTPYDPDSVMHYSFPTWMFVSGGQSPCHTGRNNGLSDGDKAGIKLAYPAERGEIATRRETRVQALEAIGRAEGVPEGIKKGVASQLESLRNAR